MYMENSVGDRANSHWDVTTSKVSRVRARQRAHECPPDLRRRVDAGAPVQLQPHHLHVAILGRHDEACGADLRRQGECAGPGDQGCSSRGLGATDFTFPPRMVHFHQAPFSLSPASMFATVL
jgi:hypothetical protein